jgi:hypothetical protein
MANSRTPPADIAPPKPKKPANAKAMSPLWRMSPQTCMAQNFCFFVFGNQHGCHAPARRIQPTQQIRAVQAISGGRLADH